MSLIERNPELYRQVYFRGEKGFENDAMWFGKELAFALERGKVVLKGDIDEGIKNALELAILTLPSYPKREYKITATYKGIKLL